MTTLDLNVVEGKRNKKKETNGGSTSRQLKRIQPVNFIWKALFHVVKQLVFMSGSKTNNVK